MYRDFDTRWRRRSCSQRSSALRFPRTVAHDHIDNPMCSKSTPLGPQQPSLAISVCQLTQHLKDGMDIFLRRIPANERARSSENHVLHTIEGFKHTWKGGFNENEKQNGTDNLEHVRKMKTVEKDPKEDFKIDDGRRKSK